MQTASGFTPGTAALWIVIVAAFLNAIFWTHRVSAFRKDRRWERGGFFGQPFDWNPDQLDPSNYTTEGKGVYRIFLASVIVWVAVFALGLFVAWQRFFG